MGMLQEQRAGENFGRIEKVCQQKGCLSSQGGMQWPWETTRLEVEQRELKDGAGQVGRM